MTPPPPSLPWLERLDWLHGLARRIVRDECAADDLTQQVVLKALRAGRADAPQRWWAHVMRNAARDEARSTRHRREREGDAASQREGSTAHSVVSDAEMQGRVAEAVLALDEPHRTVLLLRYFKGLPPRAIAQELGRPIGTVKSQLERARGLLRAQLRDEFGGSAALSLGLLPIAGGAKLAVSIAGAAPVSTAVTALGGALTMKLTLVLPVLLLVLLGAWSARNLLVSSDVASDAESAAIATLAEVDGEGAGEPSVSLAAPAGQSAPATRISAAPDAPSAQGPVETRTRPALRGVALDLEGRPLPSLELALMDVGPAGEHTTTDETGHFEFQRVAEIEVVDPALAVFVYRNIDGLRELRIARTVLFAGRVVDSSGTGVAVVRVLDFENIETTGAAAMERTTWHRIGSREQSTDDDGRFDLGHVVAWPGRAIVLWHPQFGQQSVTIPAVDTANALIVFANASESHEVLVRVLDETGRRVADAVVLVGDTLETVDHHGEVVVRVDRTTAGTELLAARPGHTPARAVLPDLHTLRLATPRWEIELTISQPGSVMCGLVIDSEGKPVSGASIGVWDATPLGPSGTTETLVLRDGRATFATVLSGSDGTFEIAGLADRPHTIRAVLRSPLRVAEVRDVLPGTTDLRLRVSAATDATMIEGVVVDYVGDPIAGALVTPEARLARPQGDARCERGPSVDGPRTRTDKAGRFRIDWVVPNGVRLRINHGYQVATVDADADDLTIVLPVACQVRVRHSTETRGRTIAVLDESGDLAQFSLTKNRKTVHGLTQNVMAESETSTDLRIPQSARTIVLTEDGREVARVAVRPDRWKAVAVDL